MSKVMGIYVKFWGKVITQGEKEQKQLQRQKANVGWETPPSAYRVNLITK